MSKVQTSHNISEQQLCKQFLLQITENNYTKANDTLESLVESKLRKRIGVSLKRVDEGLFDRLGAKAAGVGANIKAKTQNFGNRVGSATKAIGQNVAGAVTGKGFGAGQATIDAANKQIAANDPKKRAKAAQADSIINSFAKDISTLYPDINPQKVLANLRSQINFSKA